MSDIPRSMLDRIIRFLGIGRISLVDDAGDQQLAQIHIGAGGPDELEEIIDSVPRIGHYGLAYCPPEGSEAVVLFMGGRRSMGVAIADGHRASRPKGLQPGEAMLYNGVTGKYAKLDKDAVFHVNTDTLIEGKAHITGDATVDGTATAAHVIAQDGASGSFTSQDGKHITVSHGIITQIV